VQFKYLIIVFILAISCLFFLVYDLSNSKRTDKTSEVIIVSKGWNVNDCKKEEGTTIVYLGERPTSGYSINLIESYTVNNQFYIILEEKIPKELEPTLQVVTNPCIELRIPKTKKTIEIRWE
jgi:hypothetical protein|tara:strand:+ start:298 stop:663 length:366 start_codon:yes stop_codon:yes gene_type:complete